MAWSDHYILGSYLLFFFFLFTGLYFTRQHWLPFLPTWTHHYTPITFADDVEAGLHSDTFDLTGNITEGDSRSGLDTQSKKEVLKIMRSKRVGFDEARKLWFEARMKKAGIGADGRPLDPRAVMFS